MKQRKRKVIVILKYSSINNIFSTKENRLYSFSFLPGVVESFLQQALLEEVDSNFIFKID